MGSLCSRLKVRFFTINYDEYLHYSTVYAIIHYNQIRIKGTNTPRYNLLRSETPDSGSPSEMLDCDQSAWIEAREMASTTPGESNLEDEETVSEIQFDKMAAQVRQLYQPVEFLRSAVTNSLLLFKVSLRLSKTSTMEDCFVKLKKAVSGSSDSIELINTSDGPRKLSTTTELWWTLGEEFQSSITHFNSMLSSCHKYLGSMELKLTDIQIKLDDMKLLPRKRERDREYKQLEGIVKSINDFSFEIETLFNEITVASKIFQHQIDIDSN